MSGYHLCNDRYLVVRNGSLDNAYLLIMTVDGEGELMIRDEHLILRPGMFAIVPLKIPHAYYTRPNGMWEFYWTHLVGHHCCSIFDHVIEKRGYAFTLNNYREMIQLISEIVETKLTGRMFELFAYGQISRMTLLLLENLDASLANSCTPKSVYYRIKEYIDDHYTEALSIEDIASRFYFTSEHIIRVFKKEAGLTPYQYIKKLRLAHARKLLLLSNLSVNEIAKEIGYSSVSTFCAQFRETFGMTPAVFRLAMTNN